MVRLAYRYRIILGLFGLLLAGFLFYAELSRPWIETSNFEATAEGLLFQQGIQIEVKAVEFNKQNPWSTVKYKYRVRENPITAYGVPLFLAALSTALLIPSPKKLPRN